MQHLHDPVRGGSVAERLGARGFATVAGLELAATFRTAMWPISRLRPLPAPRPVVGRPAVVLVHGFLGHAGMMRPIARRLLAEGVPSAREITYPSWRLSLEEIVDRIAATVKGHDGPVDLVGHSLGAVACRTWLKVFGGHHHVRRFISVGGPHAGTSLYRLAPTQLRPALDPAGEWVRRLAEGPERVPTTVIRSAYDVQVFPPERASIPGVNEIVMRGCGHNGLLWSAQVHDAVVEALTEKEWARSRFAAG